MTSGWPLHAQRLVRNSTKAPDQLVGDTLHQGATLHSTSVASYESVAIMSNLESKLLDYWNDLTEELGNLTPRQDSKLPLYLRQRYAIYAASFLGRDLVLAVEKAPPETFSVDEYERHAATLREKLGDGVVFVISSLPSSARMPMIRRRIPFVVPKSQTFLPSVWIDLRERQPVERRSKRTRFTPAAQCLLLYHLQRKPMDATPLQEVAKAIGYSPIMMTKVKAEFEAAGICEAVKQGKSVVLRFKYARKELWEQARPFLFAPDRSQHYTQWDQPGPPALLAGMSALAKKTMISPDRMPTFALDHRMYLRLLETGTFHGCSGRDNASVLVESWAYNPGLLSDGECVDELSLCLSLADSPDERVQQQLEKLLEAFPW